MGNFGMVLELMKLNIMDIYKDKSETQRVKINQIKTTMTQENGLELDKKQ